MGRVHSEQINHGRGCQEWYHVSLSEFDTIKTLILNRHEYDKMYDSTLYRSNNPFVMNSIPTFTEPVEVIYLDLERLIDECNFSEQDKRIIDLFFKGYNCNDLTCLFKSNVEYIETALDRICKKIVYTNDYLWGVYLETSGTVKINNDIKYKRCKKCDKDLRVNEDNFSPDKRNKDGFHSFCKKCR